MDCSMYKAEPLAQKSSHFSDQRAVDLKIFLECCKLYKAINPPFGEEDRR